MWLGRVVVGNDSMKPAESWGIRNSNRSLNRGEKADRACGRGTAASPPEQPSAACRDGTSPLQTPPLLHGDLGTSSSPEPSILVGWIAAQEEACVYHRTIWWLSEMWRHGDRWPNLPSDLMLLKSQDSADAVKLAANSAISAEGFHWGL